METVAGIFINYLASIVLAAFFFAHVSDKAIECSAVMKHLGRMYTVKINRGFGFVAWLACILPGYSTMPIEWWWYYFTPISVILIVLADTWLFKLEEKESYYRYVLRMFGGIYAVSILASLAGLFWRF